MNRTTMRILAGALSLLMIGALAAAACGGDDDDDSEDGATATQQAQSDGDAATEPAGGDETADPGEPTDAPDDGNGASLDASEVCSLVTNAEAEDAFGVAMLEPEYIELPDVAGASTGSCSYVAEAAVDSLSITLYAGGDDESTLDLACENKEEISGLGDGACWYSEAHTEIQMRVGSNFVDIFVTTVEGDSTAITMAVAEKVAERLG